MIAYLDCSTGVSGDKFLGALVDAGFDPDILRYAIGALGLANIRIAVERRRSAGVTAVGVTVTESDAPSRGWREFRELLSHPGMPEPVRDGAMRALSALAEAEARVHGVAVDDVHFHEIGAADTLVDTLGVALGMHELGISELIASPVVVGSGSVSTAHGMMPVPAPATALLLRGMPIVPGAVGGELTTPTGAALLSAFATGFGSIPVMLLRRVGMGCGTRELGVPNVCRVLIGETIAEAPGTDRVVLLESNIDHLSSEELAVAADRLRDAGSLDVWQTPIVMKKGRAATLLSVLAPADEAPRLAECMIAETGTLGVRVLPADRRLADRDVAEIETSLGIARFKTAWLPRTGRVLRVESDDAARISSERGLPVDAATGILESEAADATGIQPMRQRPFADDTKPSD